MHIYTTNTMRFWSKHTNNDLHLIHEIDDDELGLRSERDYILSRDAEAKLFSLIDEKEFINLCRTKGLDGLEIFFEVHEIPYRTEVF